LGGANMPIRDVFYFLKGWEVEIPFKYPLKDNSKKTANYIF